MKTDFSKTIDNLSRFEAIREAGELTQAEAALLYSQISLFFLMTIAVEHAMGKFGVSPEMLSETDAQRLRKELGEEWYAIYLQIRVGRRLVADLGQIFKEYAIEQDRKEIAEQLAAMSKIVPFSPGG